MIYQDANGFPVESHMDGGDSSTRAGIMAFTGLFQDPSVKGFNFSAYEVNHPGTLIGTGWFKRHPTQVPWNNEWNWTRDQMLCFMAGLSHLKHRSVVRRCLLHHVIRLMFSQDFQEDVVGSWKYPWPHDYLLYGDTQPTHKSFDFAEPTLPHNWWVLIWGGRVYPLMILFPVCLLFLIGFLFFTRKVNSEQNQAIAMLSTYPKWVCKLYVKINPNWNTYNHYYWDVRGESEYGNWLEKWVKDRIK